ncbi:MAG: hypothetical protein A2Y97_00530 [Nitrospirae bacterium RBG_13_39_12]|nr:MAG: hypothetical protein A2Y97_00530 [Nitrospirae bacterium RBG_13_39_12]
MVELGQIEKPAAESFSGKRKLYCLSNVLPLEDATDEYKELFNQYWDDVNKQMKKLESIGKIKKIFCENILAQGEEALNMLAKINERALQIIKGKIEEGAVLIPVEHEEILGPFIDWGNCLRVVRTKKVFDKVLELYTEMLNKRLQNILDVIESNLSEEEAGLFIIRDEDRVKLQFPKDIEVFLITPPSYDSIMKWFRERWKEIYHDKEPDTDKNNENEA